MENPLNATTERADGTGSQSDDVLIHSGTGEVTHMVVKEAASPVTKSAGRWMHAPGRRRARSACVAVKAIRRGWTGSSAPG